MSSLESFLWGFAGSIAVEIVTLNQIWTSGRRRFPARYRSPWFWLCRLLLAGIGGGLTLAYGVTANRALAMTVGASAPLIVQAFARGVTPDPRRGLLPRDDDS